MSLNNGVFIAYIDPGTGTFILQILIAGMVGAGFYFHKAIARVLHLFGRGSKEPEKKEDQVDEGTS